MSMKMFAPAIGALDLIVRGVARSLGDLESTDGRRLTRTDLLMMLNPLHGGATLDPEQAEAAGGEDDILEEAMPSYAEQAASIREPDERRLGRRGCTQHRGAQ